MREMRIRSKGFLILLSIFVLGSMIFTGCGNRRNKNGSMLSDDGRSYGGLIEAEMNETVDTAFFDLTVEEAVKYNTYQFDDGLYQADEGMTYLLVKVTIENSYAENLSMSITDFVLDYEGNEPERIITGFGKSEIQQEEFMDNLFTLKMGESITKTILFTVEDKEEYVFQYVEYYEDDFEGDTFRIHMIPETSSVSTESSTMIDTTQNDSDVSTEDAATESSEDTTTGSSEEPVTESSEDPTVEPTDTPLSE